MLSLCFFCPRRGLVSSAVPFRGVLLSISAEKRMRLDHDAFRYSIGMSIYFENYGGRGLVFFICFFSDAHMVECGGFTA
jgi:hypothetical protein